MEIEHDPPLPPPLSFAYNLSLVKQLTTSKPKHTTMSTKDPSCAVFLDGNVTPNQNLRKHAQQQHKKQVRRRLHTSRPYQERLLNMAEARREIVTALKYHRAAMKQASDEQQQLQHQQQQQQLQHQQQQQQQQSLSLQPSHLSSFDQDGRFKSRRNPRIYPSCTTKISNYMDDFSYSSSFSSHPPPSVPNSYPNPSPVTSPFSHPAPKAENPNFTLPNQTLGLNLNLHHFNNLEAALFLNNNNNNSSLCSYSSPTSSSPPLSVVTDQDVPSIGISQGEGVSSGVDTIESSATIQTSGGLHTAMDDEGMAEIRSLGEQHQMEWNDTISLITSVWWFNCLKNMGHDAREVKTENGIVTCHDNFDEFIKFPTWLNNAHERCLEQCSEDYFQDTTFPW